MYVSFDKVIEVAQHLDLPKIDYSRNHIESRCPFCGDSRTKKEVRRFHIDFYAPYNTFIGNCHRCGESKNIISIYAHLKGISWKESSKILTNRKYDPDEAYKKLKNNRYTYDDDKEIKVDNDLDIDLNNHCYSLEYEPKSPFENKIVSKLWKFKNDRKIPDSLPLYIAHDGRYKGRIIVPIYINNNLVYFQGRSIYDDIYPKYFNPKVQKNKIILNIDNFKKDKYIIVTEGIIDAHMVEYNQGTCVVGGYIDESFLDIISKYTNQGIIICLDNFKKDNNSLNTLKKLLSKNINRYKEKMKFFVMPDEYDAKDLNDLVTKYEIQNIYEFVLKNSVSIMKLKMLLTSIK